MALTLQILGSLGVFLFGMKVMSEGIQKAAGDRMRAIMSTMTKNRFAGVFTGLLTTGLLQSSSATTVIVVSFVSAGLLTLVESIGVIMGANLGTTVTAWIIAVVGKFSVAKVAIPIIGVGLPFLFIGKGRWKNVGEILMGFGLLFYGLGLLKDAVPDPKALASTQWITDFVQSISGHGYGSVLIFLLFGVVLTLVVQSSSAAMAITVTFAVKGWIGFEESAAIVLGENIGTTVTAWLASIGATVDAKRAARAHFLFNIIGVIWMLIVFYPFAHMVQWLGEMLPESFRAGKLGDEPIAFNLAIFHTLFNFLNICFLVGFVPIIARIVSTWVKDKKEDASFKSLRYISRGLVDVGELSLPEAQNAVRKLGAKTQEMFTGFIEVFNRPEDDMSQRVVQLKGMEDEADRMLEEITEYLVVCSSAELSPRNAKAVTSMLRIASELEEISDCIYRLVKLTQKKYAKNRIFSDEMMNGIREFSDEVNEFLTFYNSKLFTTITPQNLAFAKELEDKIDDQRRRLNNHSIVRMQENGDIKAEMLNIDINNHFEKIGNHALNVIEAAQNASDHKL
jgi:phosphate:Na+ symporter